MASSKQIDSQREYSRELLALGVGAVASGLGTTLLSTIAQGNDGPLGVLAFGAVMGLASSLLDAKQSRAILRVVFGVMAGASMALLLGVHWIAAAAVGGLLIGASYAIGFGANMIERVGVALAFALALVGGMFTATTLGGAGIFDAVSDSTLFQNFASHAIWGLFLMLPAGLKYLQWSDDEILAEYKAARAGLAGRHASTLTAAEETYRRVLDEIEREAAKDARERATEIAHEVSRGLIALTKRSSELHKTIERTQERPLEVRARDLESRIKSTRDPALKRELVAGLGELVEQMRTRRRLETACARIDARQQRYLTALEKLHVTLVQNDSLSSTDGALRHSLDELTKLTEEVRWKNLSVDELVNSSFDELEDEQGDDADAELSALLSEIDTLTSSDPFVEESALPRVEMPEVEEVAFVDSTEEDEQVFASGGVDGFVASVTCEDSDDATTMSADTETEQEAHVEESATVSATSR